MSELDAQSAAAGSEKAVQGADRLRESIARALGENSDEIANGLMKRCKDGDPRCIKLAHDVATEDKKEQAIMERRCRPKRSLAIEWMNEQEWTEEDERAAKAGEGGQVTAIQL